MSALDTPTPSRPTAGTPGSDSPADPIPLPPLSWSQARLLKKSMQDSVRSPPEAPYAAVISETPSQQGVGGAGSWEDGAGVDGGVVGAVEVTNGHAIDQLYRSSELTRKLLGTEDAMPAALSEGERSTPPSGDDSDGGPTPSRRTPEPHPRPSLANSTNGNGVHATSSAEGGDDSDDDDFAFDSDGSLPLPGESAPSSPVGHRRGNSFGHVSPVARSAAPTAPEPEEEEVTVVQPFSLEEPPPSEPFAHQAPSPPPSEPFAHQAPSPPPSEHQPPSPPPSPPAAGQAPQSPPAQETVPSPPLEEAPTAAVVTGVTPAPRKSLVASALAAVADRQAATKDESPWNGRDYDNDSQCLSPIRAAVSPPSSAKHQPSQRSHLRPPSPPRRAPSPSVGVSPPKPRATAAAQPKQRAVSAPRGSVQPPAVPHTVVKASFAPMVVPLSLAPQRCFLSLRAPAAAGIPPPVHSQSAAAAMKTVRRTVQRDTIPTPVDTNSAKYAHLAKTAKGAAGPRAQSAARPRRMARPASMSGAPKTPVGQAMRRSQSTGTGLRRRPKAKAMEWPTPVNRTVVVQSVEAEKSTRRRPPSTGRHPPSTGRHPPSTSRRPQSTGRLRPQSSARRRPRGDSSAASTSTGASRTRRPKSTEPTRRSRASAPVPRRLSPRRRRQREEEAENAALAVDPTGSRQFTRAYLESGSRPWRHPPRPSPRPRSRARGGGQPGVKKPYKVPPPAVSVYGTGAEAFFALTKRRNSPPPRKAAPADVDPAAEVAPWQVGPAAPTDGMSPEAPDVEDDAHPTSPFALSPPPPAPDTWLPVGSPAARKDLVRTAAEAGVTAEMDKPKPHVYRPDGKTAGPVSPPPPEMPDASLPVRNVDYRKALVVRATSPQREDRRPSVPSVPPFVLPADEFEDVQQHVHSWPDDGVVFPRGDWGGSSNDGFDEDMDADMEAGVIGEAKADERPPSAVDLLLNGDRAPPAAQHRRGASGEPGLGQEVHPAAGGGATGPSPLFSSPHWDLGSDSDEDTTASGGAKSATHTPDPDPTALPFVPGSLATMRPVDLPRPESAASAAPSVGRARSASRQSRRSRHDGMSVGSARSRKSTTSVADDVLSHARFRKSFKATARARLEGVEHQQEEEQRKWVKEVRAAAKQMRRDKGDELEVSDEEEAAAVQRIEERVRRRSVAAYPPKQRRATVAGGRRRLESPPYASSDGTRSEDGRVSPGPKLGSGGSGRGLVSDTPPALMADSGLDAIDEDTVPSAPNSPTKPSAASPPAAKPGFLKRMCCCGGSQLPEPADAPNDRRR